ncbi:D-alanyl-D-alanine carboxypeptidase [Streptomyces caniferus]|uniref:D-alanyl-D-alanine carboxypeptidase n=1 Tax=Streptomyces caniferus TaxID=285557 RepID=UPI0037165177
MRVGAAGKAGGTPASASAKIGDDESARASAEADGAADGKADQPTAVFGTLKTGTTGDDKADRDTAASGASKAGDAGDAGTAETDAASGTADDGKAAAPSGDDKADQAAATGVCAADDDEAGHATTPADAVKPGATGATVATGDGKAPEGETKSGPKAASCESGADGDGKSKEDARLNDAVAASAAEAATEDDDEDENDSDSDSKAGSADQATQLIKAPKPVAADAADQPTRLIKALANPDSESESESERTSQFIPLKRDDAPAPKPLKIPKPEAKPKATPSAPPKPAEAPPAVSPAEPQAPLDLLAQLTNTPPPPETSVRTAVRRVKIWTPLVVLLGIIFVVVQVMRPLPAPELAIAGKSTSVFEGSTPSLPWPTEGQAVVDVDGLGRVGSYGEMKRLPIGSVAKVMTTYIILRDHPLKKGENGPLIDVDQKAEDDFTNGVREKESVVEVRKGQKISEKEALQAVMLPSANNVARLLARWGASTEEAFIKKMNDTAKELGMTNTTYTDASGLVESTVSTAEDQVKLGKKAMQDPVFREISKATEYHSTTASGTGSGVEYQKTQRNFNKLVPMYGVVGIKTGSTTKAGGNLLFAAEKKVGGSTQLIIGAVFGQHKSPIIVTATDYSKQLILTAGRALTTSTVVRKGDVVGHVDDGLGGTTPVVATKDLTAVGWPGLKVDLKLTAGGKTLPHTAKAGTQVGELTAGGGMGEVKVPVTLQKDLAEPTFGAKLTRVS